MNNKGKKNLFVLLGILIVAAVIVAVFVLKDKNQPAQDNSKDYGVEEGEVFDDPVEFDDAKTDNSSQPAETAPDADLPEVTAPADSQASDPAEEISPNNPSGNTDHGSSAGNDQNIVSEESRTETQPAINPPSETESPTLPPETEQPVTEDTSTFEDEGELDPVVQP